MDSMKLLTGGAESCIPFPPKSVFKAGGIISITSMFFGFSKFCMERVKECRKALVAEYTGTFTKGTKDKPDVTFKMVFREFRLMNRDIKCSGAITLIAISSFAF